MLKRLLFVTFIESLATILVERGVYFYTYEHMAFSDSLNLSVALSLGLAYVAGALASGPISARVGEKRLLLLTVAGQFLCHAAPVIVPSTEIIFALAVGIGLFNGLKWPVIESYIGAGRAKSASAQAIGMFNIAWSTSVPLALWVTGPLVTLRPLGDRLDAGVMLFVVAGAINLVSFALLTKLDDRPVHIPHEHPDRPPPQHLAHLDTLLMSSRWSMLACFCLLFVVAPLMPTILTQRLGMSVTWAAPFSGVIDVVRVMTFVWLWRTVAWHNRSSWLILASCVTPIGFFMMIAGGHVVWVLLGQVMFGMAMGLAYYSALYYAMEVKNASVDAGGVHEGVIGLGFFLGPLVGLIGSRLADPFGGLGMGMLVGVGPLIAVCLVGALWPLRRLARM